MYKVKVSVFVIIILYTDFLSQILTIFFNYYSPTAENVSSYYELARTPGQVVFWHALEFAIVSARRDARHEIYGHFFIIFLSPPPLPRPRRNESTTIADQFCDTRR